MLDERADAPGRLWPIGLLLILPLLGLAVLIARPELDLEWEHQPSHFWLVLIAAAVNVVLAYLTNAAAGRYHDARLILISLAFLASAGFLGLHALATPGVLLHEPNVGFAIATPVGLIIASVFAALSATPLAGPRAMAVLRLRRVLLGGLLALMAAWAIGSGRVARVLIGVAKRGVVVFVGQRGRRVRRSAGSALGAGLSGAVLRLALRLFLLGHAASSSSGWFGRKRVADGAPAKDSNLCRFVTNSTRSGVSVTLDDDERQLRPPADEAHARLRGPVVVRPNRAGVPGNQRSPRLADEVPS